MEPDALDPKAYFEKMLKVAAPWADRFSGMLNGGETILDMGCSTGHFIKMIEDKAGQVYGHDLNVKEVSYCKEQLDLWIFKKKRIDRRIDSLVTRVQDGSHTNFSDQTIEVPQHIKFVIQLDSFDESSRNFHNQAN